MSQDLITTLIGIGAMAVGFFGKSTILGFFGFKDKTERTSNQQEIDIALIKQKQEMLESNHIKHQEAIEQYMKDDADWKVGINKVIAKIAQKEGIEF